MPPRVHRSGDGTLFLTGGTNDVLSLYDARGFESAVDLAAWRSRLAARAALFERLRVPWRLLLAPEKLSVLGLKVASTLLGGDAVPPARRFLDAMASLHVVDPTVYLRDQHQSGYGAYVATDSHWTSLGAFSAFQWLMADLGIGLDGAAFAARPSIRLRYHGDLWDDAHADLPPDLFERRALPPGLIRTHANALVQLKEANGLENEGRLHSGSHAIYRNETAQHPRRVVLFGSSFSDHRAECSLLTYMAALYFRETHFIWSTSLDEAYLDRVQPDLVLIEMPERFLPLCPADDLAIDAHAETRIAAWRALQPATP